MHQSFAPMFLFVWVDALRPRSQLRSCRDGQLFYPHCSWASLPGAGNRYLAHILSPLTDNFSSWISGRGRMAVKIISWPNLHEKMWRMRGWIVVPLDSQATSLPTEQKRLAFASMWLGSTCSKDIHFSPGKAWYICRHSHDQNPAECQLVPLHFQDIAEVKTCQISPTMLPATQGPMGVRFSKIIDALETMFSISKLATICD